MSKRLVIAIDTGGTFTDCVYRIGGRVNVLKVPSTPIDPGRAILHAIEKIAHQTPARAMDVRHGTTVATNAVLERKGARVAFVTTDGFEDTLAIGRQARPDLYNWNIHRPDPLVPRERSFGTRERVSTDGSVIQPLGPDVLNELLERINAVKPESIAVSLLFSFANPRHERTIEKALRKLKIPVSLSHVLLPEFREYERASTVVLNAYVAPRMSAYISGLEKALSQRHAELSVMQSSGGILSAGTAAREPVRTILSGPAGGVIGARAVGIQAGIRNIITFDMGGTSTDVALVDTQAEPEVTIEGEMAGFPVRVPMLDIHTAGAGGGSLAWIDRAGTLQVGPQSAGASPGPACYGSGDGATVTDANLVLGRMHADHFLGGAMRLAPERARVALESVRPGRSAFATIEKFAEGIIRVANARMESALRRVSVERGHIPQSFTLLAFGGAGPVHACALASLLGVKRVLIPASPGALSALGILDADMSREFSRTVMTTPEDTRIKKHFADLELEALEVFAREGRKASVRRYADLRYAGQGFEIRVPWGARVVSEFHRMHRRVYGYEDPSRQVEVVTLRVRAVSPTRLTRASLSAKSGSNASGALLGPHRIFEEGRWRAGSLFERSALKPGNRFSGPALVVELTATTYVPTGWDVLVDSFNNMMLTQVSGRRSRSTNHREAHP